MSPTENSEDEFRAESLHYFKYIFCCFIADFRLKFRHIWIAHQSELMNVVKG